MVRLLDFTSGVHQIQQASVLEGRWCAVAFPCRGAFRGARTLVVGGAATFFNICSEFGGVGMHESRKAEEDRFLQ